MRSKKGWRFVTTGLFAVCSFLASSSRANALFGVADIVFDPTMYAGQLQQLQQEIATVTNLAQQLQYAIKNTTGGGAGVWQSNQNLLTNLGNLINEQEGLSYAVQGLTQQFQQLYPGFNVTSTAGVQSPQASIDTTLNTLNGASLRLRLRPRTSRRSKQRCKPLSSRIRRRSAICKRFRSATRLPSSRSSRFRCSANS
jgi:conjugal transfer/entry exclusion protein